MAGLIARAFRVQNFRNIADSGWVPLDRVTALVGRNESGKTALLRALHKFNPATPLPYVAQREFPRDRFAREYRPGGDWPVSSLRFEIAEPLLGALGALAAPGAPPAFAVATRWYSGALKFEFEPALAEETLAPAPVLAAIDALSEAVMRLAAPAPDREAAYLALRRDLLDWTAAARARIEAHDDLMSAEGRAALKWLSDEARARGRPESADAILAFLGRIGPAVSAAGRAPLAERLAEKVRAALPTFIYFDDYGILDSAIYLPRFIEDLKHTPDAAKVRTINAIFKHVQLPAEEISALGRSRASESRIKGDSHSADMLRHDQEMMELRSIKLTAASNDITRRFSAWWKQRRHTIRYHADGDFFRVWVADDRQPGIEIELENRSQGFQWFFSFYLVFLVESEEMHKDAVLLLDEPGLHLHPTAQQELIEFMEELSARNQIVYTTHSPFLIDGRNLERVRPIFEDAQGHARVAVDAWPGVRDTVFPLEAAAGYAMAQGLFRQGRNLLVEGIAEFLYLSALSLLCRASGRAALAEGVSITPCGGAAMVAKLAGLAAAEQIRPVMLLGSAAALRLRDDPLIRSLYGTGDRQIVLLDEVLGVGSAAIEEVIGEFYLMPVLDVMLARPIAVSDEDRARGGTVETIVAAAARQGVALPEGWRVELARLVASRWSVTGPSSLPSTVLDRAATLFAEINRRFAA